MKRVGNLFEQVYDISNLVLAHQNARKCNFKKKESEEISMEQLNNVMYDDRPEDVIVRPTSVDVMTLIEPVNVTDDTTGKTTVKFKCNVERYKTSEYIDKLKNENVLLNEQVTQAQIGLVEVYELIAGGM